MTRIGWDDQGDRYSAWDRIRDERRAEKPAASGMEARRAAAENTDAVHDSPTAEGGDAQ